jgi:hypothetical protein
MFAFVLCVSAFAQTVPETQALPPAITVMMTQVGKDDHSNILCAGQDAYFLFDVPGHRSIGIGAMGKEGPWSMYQELDEDGGGQLRAVITLPDQVDREDAFLVISDSASPDDIRAFAVHVNASKKPESFAWTMGMAPIRGKLNVQVQEPHVSVAKDRNKVHWEVFSYVIKRCPAQ